MLPQSNEHLNFELLGFEIFPFSKQKITLKCVPIKTGTVRLLAFFFKVLNIPRYYVIDEEFDCSQHFKTYMYTNTNKSMSDEYSAKSIDLKSQANTQAEIVSENVKEKKVNTQSGNLSDSQVKIYFKNKSKNVLDPSSLNCIFIRLLCESRNWNCGFKSGLSNRQFCLWAVQNSECEN